LLQVVGIAIQSVGILLAGWGFLETYREHDPDGRGFWSFYVAPAAERGLGALQRTAMLARRLLRRPRPVRVAVGSASLSLSGTLRARGLVGFTPLDASDLSAAVQELERRINDVNSRMGRETGRLDDELDAERQAREDLAAALEATAQELRQRDARVATGGLRKAVTGLLLNAGGLLLIAIGIVLAAAA
jgi:hypothetical protein